MTLKELEDNNWILQKDYIPSLVLYRFIDDDNSFWCLEYDTEDSHCLIELYIRNYKSKWSVFTKFDGYIININDLELIIDLLKKE